MATVIDALLVTLEMDTSKFQQGVKSSMEFLGKLEQNTSSTAEKLKAHGETASQFYTKIRGAATALLTAIAGKGFMQLMSDISDTDRGLGRMAEKFKLNVQELNTYQQAMVAVGGSTEEFTNDTRGLGNMLRDLENRIPGTHEALWKLWRVGVRGVRWGAHTDMLQVLDQLAARAQKSERASLWIQEQMGFSDSMMRLLKMGPAGIAQLRKEMGELSQVTAEGIKQDQEWENAKRRLGTATTQIGRTIADAMVPVLESVTSLFLRISAWAVKNQATVKAAFTGIAIAVGIAGIAAAAAAIPIGIISLKIGLIAAAVGILVGGVTWMVIKFKQWLATGQETTTMLGKFFRVLKDGWESVKTMVMVTLGTIWDIMKSYFKIWGDEFKLLWAIITGDSEGVKKAWDQLMKDLGELIQTVMNLIVYQFTTMAISAYHIWQNLWEDMKKSPTEFVKWMADKFLTLFQFSGPVQAVIGGALKMQLRDAAKGLSPEDAVARLRGSSYGGAGGSGARSIQQETSIGQVNVVLPNATDAKGVADGLGPELKRGLSSYTMIPFAEGWR